MKVLKLAIVIAIAYGVWFQFVGNGYETGRWRLSEECGEFSSHYVSAMWVWIMVNEGKSIEEKSSNRYKKNENKKVDECVAWLLANSD